MKLSKTQRILHPQRFTKKRADGTLRIVRASYSSPTQSWWDIQKRVFERDGYRCRKMKSRPGSNGLFRCVNGRSNGTPIHCHHNIPLSKGGKTTMSNLLTLCEPCHHTRHHHMK